MHILITRPSENTYHLTKRLQDLGHQVTIDPLMHLTPVTTQSVSKVFHEPFRAIVTTSQQAIRCLSQLTADRNFPLWCVGSESAKIAKSLGFLNVYSADGNAQDLVNRIKDTVVDRHDKPFLHASGDVIRVDVAESLNRVGIPAERIIVYKTHEARTLSKETQNALISGTLDAILFYSPRTASLFHRLCKAAKLETYCSSITAACLSDAIKRELEDLPWKKVSVAKKTTTDDLLMTLMMAD